MVWHVVSGSITYPIFSRFIDKLGFEGANLREVTLCFLYSVMAVMDGASDEGRVKECSLPFEGMLEVRKSLGWLSLCW